MTEEIALLTEFQAAEALAVERTTLASWRRRGLGPPFLRLPSLGHGAVRYRRADLENFIAAAIQAGAPFELARRLVTKCKGFSMNADASASDKALKEALALIFQPDAPSTALREGVEKAIGARTGFEAAVQQLSAAGSAAVIRQPSIAEIDKALDEIEAKSKLLRRRAKIAGDVAAELGRKAHARAEIEAARLQGSNADLAERALKLERGVARYLERARRTAQLVVTSEALRRAMQTALYYAPDLRSPGALNSVSARDILVPPDVLFDVRAGLKLPGVWPGSADADEEILAPVCVKGASVGTVHALAETADRALLAEYGKCCTALAEMLRLDRELVGKAPELRYLDGGLVFGPDRFPHWTPGRMKIVLPSPGDGRNLAAA